MKQLVLPRGSRSGNRVELLGKEHHYLARVRRVAPGEQLAALDGDQRLILRVIEVTAHSVVLAVEENRSEPLPPGPAITLFPFLLKARKLDDVVRQACEAGAAAIVPVQGDHCVARTDDEDGPRKVQRWESIAREAAQQSGNARVCRVEAPIRSSAVPGMWQGQDGPLLFFHQTPLDTGNLHRYLVSRPKAVGLIIGPEGGLSAEEVALFRNHGALPVWLGPFVLRAETASLYAIAAVNTLLQEPQEWTIP